MIPNILYLSLVVANGNSAYLLKESAKRRRSKAQIAADKLLAEQQQAELAAFLSSK